MTELEDKVREAVGKVVDLEIGLTFVEMHMITYVKEEEPDVVKVQFIPSSPFCPFAFKLAMDVKNAALKVAGIKKSLGLLSRAHDGVVLDKATGTDQSIGRCQASF